MQITLKGKNIYANHQNKYEQNCDGNDLQAESPQVCLRNVQ